MIRVGRFCCRRNQAAEKARQPISRVLSAPCEVGRPFLWDAPHDASLATNPGGGTRTSLRPVTGEKRPNGRRRPYSVLLPVGFTVPPLLPRPRCALAAPFRPCPRDQPVRTGRSCTGGLFSVALSLRSPPPAVSRHRVPVEPGLSSDRRLLHRQRPSSCLATARVPRPTNPVKQSAWRQPRSRHSKTQFAPLPTDRACG